MIETHADSGTGQPTLSQAILLYSGANHLGGAGNRPFASTHNVTEIDGRYVIGAGVPVTKTALLRALELLNPSGSNGPQLIEEYILAKGDGLLVWWSRPQSRRVFFDADTIGQCNAVTPHPGLIWKATARGLKVFAFKGARRPKPTTPLYMAPYLNVSVDGWVCLGSGRPPMQEGELSAERWEESFFESAFTHPNRPNVVNYKGGATRFWRDLLAGTYAAFPSKVLLPQGSTLQEMFDRFVRGGQ